MNAFIDSLPAVGLSLPTQRGVLEELALGEALWRSGLVPMAIMGAVATGMALMVVLYELVLLRKERAAVRAELRGLDRARGEAEQAARLARLEPHFLFNSLNALGQLIAVDPRRAALFTEHLAALHRYLLERSAAALVPLEEELSFLESYVALMALRFGAAFQLVIEDRGGPRHWLVPPTALQGLVENALKHNQLSEARPLQIAVTLGRDRVSVGNAHRPRRAARASLGSGLRCLDERVRQASGRGITVAQGEGRFVVTVPLAEPAMAEAMAGAIAEVMADARSQVRRGVASPLHAASVRLR